MLDIAKPQKLNATAELKIELSSSVSKRNYIQISSCVCFSQYGFLPNACASSASPQPRLASLPKGPAGRRGEELRWQLGSPKPDVLQTLSFSSAVIAPVPHEVRGLHRLGKAQTDEFLHK